jgi:hypothetical protein
MKNPYKRTDIYRCDYAAHAKFKHRVSAYHVEKVKACFPHGCLIFNWSCALFNKGKSCPRKFKYVGRLCSGCNHFSDEKLNYQPSIKISDLELDSFREDIEQFEEWISENSNKDLELLVTVNSVKPCFKKTIAGGKGQIRLDGYLLAFKEGFIGRDNFEDYFYAHVSPNQQERLKFARGDKFEAKGRLSFDRGRILFPKIWAIEFESKSGDFAWSHSEALVARQTASHFKNQSENCLRCWFGALVDVSEKNYGNMTQKRELFCLKGFSDPSLCYINQRRKIDYCL